MTSPRAAKQRLEELFAMSHRITRAIDDAWSRPADAKARVLTFRVGDRALSLPLDQVREVTMPAPSLTRAPRSPRHVLGVMNLRGRAIAVIDTRHLMEQEATRPHQPSPDARVLVVESDRGPLGLLIDQVTGIESAASQTATLVLDSLIKSEETPR